MFTTQLADKKHTRLCVNELIDSRLLVGVLRLIRAPIAYGPGRSEGEANINDCHVCKPAKQQCYAEAKAPVADV